METNEESKESNHYLKADITLLWQFLTTRFNIHHQIFINAFFVLVLVCFSKDSWIHRALMCVRVIITMRDAHRTMLWPHIADQDLIAKRCEVPDRAVVNPISNKWLTGQTNTLHPNPTSPPFFFFCHASDKRGNWHQWISLWSVTWQSIITEGNGIIMGTVIRNQALRSLVNCLWNTVLLQVLSINAITNACSFCCTKTSSGVQDKPNMTRTLNTKRSCR